MLPFLFSILLKLEQISERSETLKYLITIPLSSFKPPDADIQRVIKHITDLGSHVRIEQSWGTHCLPERA